jgi:3',5'-cyclic AMP phosphodiesterase CpdA
MCLSVPLALFWALPEPTSELAAGVNRPMPFRIALLSDLHLNSDASGERAQYLARLDRAIDEVNGVGVDLVLVAGDLTEDGSGEQLGMVRSKLSRLRAPFRVVPGNHDVGAKPTPSGSGIVTEERLRAYERALGASFGAETLSAPRPGSRARIRLLRLNGSLFGSKLRAEERQWDALRRTLSSPRRDPVVILMHYPAFGRMPTEDGGGYWYVEPEPRSQLLAAMHGKRVAAVLSGHVHRPIRNSHDGVEHITTRPISFGLPKGKEPEGWTLITVASGGAVTVEDRPFP